MSYLPPAASAASAYSDTPPAGIFSAVTNVNDSVNPMLDVTGEGYIETLLMSRPEGTTGSVTVDIEVDGSMIGQDLVLSETAPMIGTTMYKSSSIVMALRGESPPIKFDTSLKVWLKTGGKHVLVAGRLL